MLGGHSLCKEGKEEIHLLLEKEMFPTHPHHQLPLPQETESERATSEETLMEVEVEGGEEATFQSHGGSDSREMIQEEEEQEEKGEESSLFLEEEEREKKEKEQIAVEALLGASRQQPFFQRVQNAIPLLRGTVSTLSHAYESTKNSNGVLRYSAESVESLSSMITKPVLSTLEPVLGPLDRFASNQLDKVEKNFPSLRSAPTTLPPLHQSNHHHHHHHQDNNHDNNIILNPIKGSGGPGAGTGNIKESRELPPLKMHLLDIHNHNHNLNHDNLHLHHQQQQQQQHFLQQQQEQQHLLNQHHLHQQQQQQQQQQQHHLHSQQQLPLNSLPSMYSNGDIRMELQPPNSTSIDNGVAAPDQQQGGVGGGIPTSSQIQQHQQQQETRWAISKLGDDTIRALRYCLSFLEYASENLVKQLNILRQAVSDTGAHAVAIMNLKQNPDGTIATTSGNLMMLLSRVKREIVETLRKVVDMLGKYSSSYLPVDARHSVRSFILSLPARLSAVTVKQPGNVTSDEEIVELEAQKVFALASESTNLLKNIEHVIKTTVIAAEYTLGHSEPLPPTEGVPKFRSRYSSGASEQTVSNAAGPSVPDVEMS